MFGTYNPQSQLERWKKIRQDADLEIQRLTQPPAAINQNFNIVAPSQNDFDARFINSYDEVKNTTINKNTIFMDKNQPMFYMKMTDGDVKAYKFEEIKVLDEKDRKIQELENKINELMKGYRNYGESNTKSYTYENEQSVNTINDMQQSTTNGKRDDKKKS